MYFDLTEGATALFSSYAAAVFETMQKPWRRLSSPSSLYSSVPQAVSDVVETVVAFLREQGRKSPLGKIPHDVGKTPHDVIMTSSYE